MWDWDEDKRQQNRAKHGVDFTAIYEFDWSSAQTHDDQRRDYGEDRFVSLGYIGPRLYFVTWTPRAGRIRIINLRKANVREIKAYAGTAQSH